MKKMKVLLLSVLFLTISALAVNAQNQKQSTEKKTASVSFNVNMHCKSCQEKIERTIPFEKGVKDIVVDLEHKTVKVIYDPRKTTEAKIQKAFENLDYTCAKMQEEVVKQSDISK